MYLSVDPGFLSTLNFYEASHFVLSTHRMDAPDRPKGQRDKRICLFVHLCLTWSLTQCTKTKC